MLFGDELRRKIRAMRLSENEFAKLCGFTYTTLSNLLANKTKTPKPEVVSAVERVAKECCPRCGQWVPDMEALNASDSTEEGTRRRAKT